MPLLEKKIVIVNKLGLHARAATQLVQLANNFSAKVTLQLGEKKASANSVLGLMMLEGNQGKELSVTSEGAEAAEAMAAIEALITGRFNEQE